MDRLGIDIGSKTIKVALVSGQDGTLLYSEYRRHRSQVRQALAEVLHDCIWRIGSREVTATVTGSAGMRVAELFSIPFVQEVVALRRAVEREQPGADAILEMGGEDTKLVYLTGVPEQRMNNICAGGTGGFIDMMASTMGVRPDDMNCLAQGASTIYPIASRCAVFAKSDVRPLVNAGARREDIAASVLRAVCTQAVAGLSAGRPLEGRVVLLGGPFRYIPALRDAFCAVTGIPREDAVVPADAHLFVALGAAVSPECSAPLALDEFEALVTRTAFEDEEGIPRLAPLFSTRADYDAFRKRHLSCKIPRGDASMRADGAEKNLFLGIDAGSTTMKMALVDETGALRAYEYRWNRGDVNVSLPRWLKSIYDSFDARYDRETKLRRSLIVGYGEEYCKAAYRIDSSEVETVAHLRAATELDPEVDFLIDIGGQDVKCFYVRDGAITDLVLNEACSSGCGSLFDSTARSLGMTKEAFAHEALFARSPVDLGTRCATFMDSRVKHAQKDGAALGDIAAGICYSTARNALYKVVRQPDFSKVGKHVVVTGGAFANDALLRAFELETKTEVSRPDLSEIMGAWGAALLARDEWLALRERDPQAAEAAESAILRREELERLDIQTKNRRCGLCANRCELVVTRFFDGPDDREGRLLVTGNRCERGAEAVEGTTAAGGERRPPNMVRLKNELIAACDDERSAGVTTRGTGREKDALRVGIPKVLALYESYPFWRAFFDALGVPVVAGAPSGERVYRAGMGNIPSESACYPSKLAYGHCVDLAANGADLLFVPYLGTQFARRGLLGLPVDAALRECPLVEELPAMLEGNLQGLCERGVSFACPDLRAARSLADVVVPLARSLAGAGIEFSRGDLRDALQQAQAVYRRFFAKLQRANERALARVDAGEFPGALLVGHPYHADPGISHGIDELLGKMGYAVLERGDYGVDALGGESAGTDGLASGRPEPDMREAVFAWAENRALQEAVRASSAHPDLQFIVLRSFGCGVDALAADGMHDMLRWQGRVSAELKIDDIVDLAAVRIRVRSLAYAMRQRSGEVGVYRVYREQHGGESASSGARLESRGHAGRYSTCPPAASHAPKGPMHARRPKRALTEAMRSYGFTLTADGAGRLEPWMRAFLSVIVFSSDAGAFEFSDWDEVDDYVTQRELGIDDPEPGREVPASRLVELMRDLGYEREERTAGREGRRLLRFRSASEHRPFVSWGEVDKFVHQLRHAAGR